MSTSVLVEGWKHKDRKNQRLLLTRYDVGADINSASLQPRLDFLEAPEAELFAGQDMGEDSLLALQTCKDDLAKIKKHLAKRAPLMIKLGQWAKGIS